MTRDEVRLMAGELGPIIREYVAKAVEPLLAEQRTLTAENQALAMRILEIETRPEPEAERGEKGEVGLRGDVGVGIASLILNADGRLIGHLTDGRSLDIGPAPKGLQGERGEIGPAGRDAQVDLDAIVAAVLARVPAPIKGDRGEQGPRGQDAPEVNVEALVTRVAALVPVPRDGRDGAPGAKGEQGSPGRDADPLHVKQLVTDAVAAIPKPQNGRDGRDGVDGKDGLTVVGKDGAPGLAGKDGTLDGLTFDFDGERTVTIRHKDGTPVEGGLLVFPVVLDRGVFTHGKSYEPGDAATHDGHLWICQHATGDSPGESSSSWRLAVRRGKQGKEGRAGRDFTPPKNNTPPLYG